MMSSRAPADLVPALVAGPGYWSGPLMSVADIAVIDGEIERLFLAQIARHAPERRDEFARAGLSRYHEVSHLVDHGRIWGRLARRFDAAALAVLDRTDLYRGLRELFGDFTVTDEEDVGEPLVRWRIVRPGESGDIGPVHADSWFWRINKWPYDADRSLIKIWTMLHGAPGESGLMVLPDSHKVDYAYSAEIRDGSPKPSFDAAGLPMRPVRTLPGESVVFHYDLLHGGMVTGGSATRVSFELTMAVKRDRLPSGYHFLARG